MTIEFTPNQLLRAAELNQAIEEGGIVRSVAGRTGNVILTADDIPSLAPVVSPLFTGEPRAPTAAPDTNTQQLATTGFVMGQAGDAAPLMAGAAGAGTSLRFARQDHRHPTDTTRAALAGALFTGALGIILGAAGTPGLYFSGDPNTGIYSAGADQINFSAGGTLRLSLSTSALTSTLAVVAPSGSITTPGFRFADASSGFYRPSTNVIGITTSGVLRVSVSSGGLVSTVPVVLPADPTNALEAATKQYVDAVAAAAVLKTGDTMTGALTMNAALVMGTAQQITIPQDPAAATDAARKGYVDARDLLNVLKTGDSMTGNLTIVKAAASLVFDHTVPTNNSIIARIGGLPRWQLYVTTSTPETGANAGSNWQLTRYDDAGTGLGIAWAINRATGEWGIGGASQSGTAAVIRTAGTVASERGLSILNSVLATDAEVDLRFQTGNAATRGRIRGKREGATANGSLILSSAPGGTETDVLTLQSDTHAVFAGQVRSALAAPAIASDLTRKDYVDGQIAAVAGAWVKVADVAVTAVNQIDITWTTGAYRMVRFNFDGIGHSVNNDYGEVLAVRWRAGGAYISAANYSVNGLSVVNGTVISFNAGSMTAGHVRGDGANSAATDVEGGTLTLYEMANGIAQAISIYNSIGYNGAPANTHTSRGIRLNGLAAPVDGARFFWGSGNNFKAQGRIVVEGLKV